MKSVRQMRIGGQQVGIVGLDEAVEELVAESRGMEPNEIREVLLDRLAKQNYIPGAWREAYGDAFYREYLRLTGEPAGEEAPGELTVTVVGPGCSGCEQLERSVIEVLSETGIAARLEHVRDISAIAETAVMGTPALLLGGRIISVGEVPPKAVIRRKILEAIGGAAAPEAVTMSKEGKKPVL